ncbi:PHD finger protein At1g33420 [Cornus florida]|uniref:PHD finger protein At1g33420 n=1 Tax=Cornus florida TaxID=4283 RepID=UPI002899DC68|nr:PHD finger protein At1g33420 [Cornus florida]
MVVNYRPVKRMRRMVDTNLYDFYTFPAAGDAVYGGPFRSSVQRFLSKHARLTFPPSLFPCLMTWQIQLGIGGPVSDDGAPAVVVLYIVEEDVTRSRSVYCDQCRVVGWSGHPVCRKRYHFIIRKEEGSSFSPLQAEGYQKECTICGHTLQLSDSRCKLCGSEAPAHDFENWVYLQLVDNTHLLHGVIHSNGYGHLLTLNGKEGGSKFLRGSDLMNLWDRLCTTLAVRKVSVMDVSRKYGMEYRLLHAITGGHPWYGNWGYEFGAGSYALTQSAYQIAIRTLSSIPLSIFSYQGRRPKTDLQTLIAFYQSISEQNLVSLGDLFSFILRLIREIHGSQTGIYEKSSTMNVLCTWMREDVERVEQGMIKVLLAAANDSSWVSRRALKGALCKAASPNHLDYCLKHLGGKIATNGMVVSQRCNPGSSAIEYRLEPCGFVHKGTCSNSNIPSEEHLIRDLKFLYDSILHPQTMVNNRPQATRKLVAESATKLLDCKQFVKDYKPDKMAATKPFAINLWCHVELAGRSKEDSVPPPELIVLPENATVADLKLEATKAFREVYAMFKRFETDEILDFGPIDDSMTLKLLVGLTGSVRVRGRCQGTHGLSRFKTERGTENWTVDCMCGARDDDGERMLACDTCGVWQHTRCAGIDNYDEIPANFICMRCLNSNVSKKVVQFSEESSGLLSSRSCRDESAIANSPRLRTKLRVNFNVS